MGDVYHYMELFCKESLHWVAFQHCSNELQLRHLILHLDADTIGHKTSSGTTEK